MYNGPRVKKDLKITRLRRFPILFLRRHPEIKRFILAAAYRFNLLEVLFKMSRAFGGKFPVLADGKINFMGSLVIDSESWNGNIKNYRSQGLNTNRATFTRHKPQIQKFENMPDPVISVISSLYECDLYIDLFLGDLVSQENFDEIEFYLVLVKPSDYVLNMVQRANQMYANIRFEVFDNLIGIYEAWNIAITKTTSPILTNANADDIRKSDSFIFQARTMKKYQWVDVLYQDIYLAHEFDVNWETLEDMNLEVKMGHVTESGLVLSGVNYPHHAPAWRRNLHEDVGYFNELYKSAADYEFWVRCAKAGKTFFHSRYKHAGYYLNPKGLSTSQNSAGLYELFEIQKRFAVEAPSRSQMELSNGIADYKDLRLEGKLTTANHLIFPEIITKDFIQEILMLRADGRK
jgi:hypothetical protein